MSASVGLMAARGLTRELGAYVVGACFDSRGEVAAFGLGDGSVHLVSRDAGGDWARVAAHDGAVMALAPDIGGAGFLSAGDDGVLARISEAGDVASLFSAGGKWIEQLAVFAEARGGLIACAAGRIAYLLDAAGRD